MKDAYKPVWFILFVVLGLVAVVGVFRMRAGGGAGAGGPDRVPWTTDLAAAKERAGRENKAVLVYFTATWCGPCQQMKRTTWSDERVAAEVARRFIPVKVDVDEQPAVAQEFGVSGIPRVEVVAADGARHTVTTGGVPPDVFLTLLESAGKR